MLSFRSLTDCGEFCGYCATIVGLLIDSTALRSSSTPKTDEQGHEVRKWDNATQNGSWTLQQLNMTKLRRYATEKEIADREATIVEARLAHSNAVENSRDIWARYESLRTKRGQAHEAFSKLAFEESNCAALLAGKQRKLGKLRPAPVMEPPSHLVPLIDRFRAQAQLV
jgi:hypothetical protein